MTLFQIVLGYLGDCNGAIACQAVCKDELRYLCGFAAASLPNDNQSAVFADFFQQPGQ